MNDSVSGTRAGTTGAAGDADPAGAAAGDAAATTPTGVARSGPTAQDAAPGSVAPARRR
ncbi:hypothetical protein NLX85_21425 [Micromonospora sp. A3M-1-15]|uniref:hypothetical protein n=1 Tax=Micromonospora sp. A3M-1-15 TaxID=2962035 RepID=UPI0020B683D5|nr:hypothetical protein [Micromonospora sp. A3M-1-15]MCP3785929.1 hypothetical protein [Micromonospora sp. A3M-1-15]